MSTGRLRVISARPGLRLAALILVLAGLFGMHGLDGHNAVAMGSVAEAVMAELPMSAAGADASLTAGRGHQVGLPGAHSVYEMKAGGASWPRGLDMGMAAMCVAILAAGLIALVRFLLGGRVRSLLRMLARQARAVLQHPGRDPDPASLTALSIQRC